MMVRIGKRGQSLVDYTEDVTKSSEVMLRQERERGAFNRVVSDIHLVLSDLNETFSTLFDNSLSTDRWEVEVSDNGRILFVGEIKYPINFDVATETVYFDAFALEKMFWEATRNHTMKEVVRLPVFSDRILDAIYTNVQTLLPIIFNRTNIDDLLEGYDIDSLYATRPIRAYGDGSADGISNDGRLKEIDPDMAVFEFLDAMAKYYNAEFFIDTVTRKLVMKKRGAVHNDVQTDLTDKVMDEGEIKVQIQDAEKYDYILTNMKMPKASAPAVTGASQATTGKGIIGSFTWRITYVLQFEGLDLESEAGIETGIISVPAVNVGGTLYAAKVAMTIPTGPTGTIKRKLYRQSWSNTRDGVNIVDMFPVGNYYLVQEIADNTTTSINDEENPALPLQYLQTTSFDGSVWFGFDESTAAWRTPLKNDGTNDPPIGRILDVTPKLRFVNINNRSQMKEFSILDVIEFFGGDSDFNLQTFQDEWKDLFITKKKLVSSFDGLNYQIGDSVVLPSGFKGAAKLGTRLLKIESASSELMNEVSELELVTL